jgi:membrane protease YdiL (CAAX protease family)
MNNKEGNTSGYILRMYFGKEEWILNPNISSLLILSGVWWNIKSVLFEELIFRGVLLYILIKKAGPAIAIAISSIAFGIYHWFSMEIFGNIVQMILIFFVTGAMGLLLAYAFYKTSSILIPIAIHLG